MVSACEGHAVIHVAAIESQFVKATRRWSDAGSSFASSRRRRKRASSRCFVSARCSCSLYSPWPQLSGPEAVQRAALDKERPPVPRHWDAKLGALIRRCWHADPAGRPSFAAVLEQLAEVFKSSVKISYEEYNNKSRSVEAGGAAAAGCCVIS